MLIKTLYSNRRFVTVVISFVFSLWITNEWENIILHFPFWYKGLYLKYIMTKSEEFSVNSYLLSMWEFIVFITLEPQSVHNSGVWANHHRAGNNDQEKPRPIISLGNPIWPHFNAENGIDFLVKFRVKESREMENQREDPRTKNNNLKCEMRQPCWNAHS